MMPASAIFALVVTAVLLAAVAVFLVIVVVLLGRIVKTLRAVDATVDVIARNAEPLDGLFHDLNAQLVPVADALEAAGGSRGTS